MSNMQVSDSREKELLSWRLVSTRLMIPNHISKTSNFPFAILICMSKKRGDINLFMSSSSLRCVKHLNCETSDMVKGSAFLPQV